MATSVKGTPIGLYCQMCGHAVEKKKARRLTGDDPGDPKLFCNAWFPVDTQSAVVYP